MKQRLLDKNVIITGASSGIGRVTALEFAKEGANVALFARNEERLEEVKKEIEALGRKALVLLGDVTNKEDIENAVKKTIEEFGSIDIFHSNAGIYLIKRSALDEIPDDTFFNATDLIEIMIAEGKKVIRFPLNGTWIDIGNPQEYQKAQDLVKHL